MRSSKRIKMQARFDLSGILLLLLAICITADAFKLKIGGTASTSTTTTAKPKHHDHNKACDPNNFDSISALVKHFQKECEGFARAGNHNGFHKVGCCVLLNTDPLFPMGDKFMRDKWINQCILRFESLMSTANSTTTSKPRIASPIG